jgi:hypothetical protein
MSLSCPPPQTLQLCWFVFTQSALAVQMSESRLSNIIGEAFKFPEVALVGALRLLWCTDCSQASSATIAAVVVLT